MLKIRAFKVIATLALLLISCWATSAMADDRQLFLVVNAHGAKTSKKFVLPSSVRVYTPGVLADAYSFKDDEADPKGIENIFAAGRLPAFDRASVKSSWKLHEKAHVAEMPDVVLAPLNFDTDLSASETAATRELKYLKENMNHKPRHWAYDTGDDAMLLIRKSRGVETIVGHQAVKQFVDGYDASSAEVTGLGVPIVLVVPRQNKIKVLSRTSLGEVTELLEREFAARSAAGVHVLMAACNEDGKNGGGLIVLSTDPKKSTAISDLYPR